MKKNILKPRQPIYKRVSIPMPHCPVCKERLGGNNSGISPYQCSCGVWESTWTIGDGLYFVIKIPNK